MDYPIASLKGVGDSLATKLAKLGILTAQDLLYHFPKRYEDYSNVVPSAQLKPGTQATIKVKVIQAKGRYVRRGMHITEAVASDSSGSIRLVWFNQPYRAGAIKSGQDYYISGSFELSRGRLAMMNPSMELASDFPVNTARIIPIYKETKGLKSAAIRKLVKQALDIKDIIRESLPAEVVEQNDLLDREQALQLMHFPESAGDIDKAKERLGFEELFGLSLASLHNKRQFEHDSGVTINFEESLAQKFVTALPYDLTNAQRKVTWQCYKDMQSTHPMNRLVEGDVGSGKTIVAAMAAVMAIKAGYQVTFMAPTEILARQHAETLHELMAYVDMQDEVSLLIGSMKPVQKRLVHSQIKSGKTRLIVGTHALITDTVDLHNLGLVIIDEQHRFGVEQRKKLQAKAGRMPHVLSMTATPIPRTLALTLYGELDISILDEMPPGRTPTITEIVSPNSRAPIYKKIDEQIKQGRQMFVVCPIIQDSDVINVLSAEKVYEGLSKKVFKHRRLGLLHGKMKTEDKDNIMNQFIAGELDILVSTTVIEVGVNVPNATIMMIEGAERFGLAQAHQLRGRVGRGTHQGYCYLVMSDSKPPTRRLKALQQSTDGFKLAELDLEIRGPGALYGSMQSGELDLRVANLSDSRLIARVRAAAANCLDQNINLAEYPYLAAQVKKFQSVTNLN